MQWKQALAAAFALTVAASPVQAQQGEGVAAVVNDQVISTWDVRQRALLLMISSGIEPSQEALQRVRVQALRGLVDEALQLQEAKEYKIEISDKEVESSFANIARANNSTTEQLRRELISAGVSPSTLYGQLKADIAWRRLVNGRFGSRIRVSAVQVRDTLARIAANASKPQYLVSEIFLPAEGDQELRDAEAGAQRLIEEMRNGATFPLVARQFSAAPSAAAGGDLGWVAAGELRPELQSAIEGVAPGAITAPFRAQGGIYILLLRDRRAGVDAGASARVTLRQVSAPETSRAALTRAATAVNGCDSLDATLRSVTGVQVSDLGEAPQADLADEVRDRIATVEPGKASAVFASPQGPAFMVVCARTASGDGLPNRDEIEDRLFDQELAMLAQRYLRNLRREATIITRTQ